MIQAIQSLGEGGGGVGGSSLSDWSFEDLRKFGYVALVEHRVLHLPWKVIWVSKAPLRVALFFFGCSRLCIAGSLQLPSYCDSLKACQPLSWFCNLGIRTNQLITSVFTIQVAGDMWSLILNHTCVPEEIFYRTY